MKKNKIVKKIIFFFTLITVTNIFIISGCSGNSIKLDSIQQAIIKGPPEIEEAVICKDIDDNYYPIEPTTIFPPDTKSIFLAVSFKNFTPADSLKVIWYFTETDRLLGTQEYSPQQSGSGNHYFNINNPGFFQPGKYNAKLYFNGDIFKQIDFLVEES